MSNKRKILVVILLLITILFLITTVVINCEKALIQEQEQSQDENFKVVVVRGGRGEGAKQGNTVTILYSGYILDSRGNKNSIDREVIHTFTLGQGEVIRAWEDGVLGMRVGESIEITAPPSYAYGDNDEIPFLPPNSTLFFEITMMSIESSD